MSAALTLSRLRVDIGGRTIIDDVTASFSARSVTVVVGRSGAGKSVLWKAVAGLIPRSGGDVIVGVPPLVFVHQDPALLEDRTALENLTFFALARGGDRASIMERVDAVIAALGLEALLHRPAAHLSPAQARRVALGRALVLRPGVLIVDEPTTGLDAVDVDDVGDALVHAAGDAALIVITHHPRTIARLDATAVCRLLRVDNGGLHPIREIAA
jgi:ABC-type multidrug transport system ATPase subunit